MPLYDYHCEICGKTVECYVKTSEFNPKAVICCNRPMERCFPIPALKKEFFTYFDKGLGQYVSSNREREEVMKSRRIVQE